MIPIYLVSFLWGVAEATFFFIVPDVWLTAVALKSGGKKLLSAVGFSVLGALIGGILIYWLAGYFQNQIFSFFEHIPGIQMNLIEEAKQITAQHGLMALPIGVFQGIPYKIFAAAWRLEGGNLAFFVGMSIVARAGRFLLAVGITRWICIVSEARIQNWKEMRMILMIAFWVIFYLFYFFYKGW